MNQRQKALDLAVICIFGTLYFVFVVTTQTGPQVSFGDNPWYLNRAVLFWKGINEPNYIYNVGYPLLVGLFYKGTHALILSAMLLNILSMVSILATTYLLGINSFGRNAGLIACVAVAGVSPLIDSARLFQADVIFVALLLWIMLALLLFMKHPSLLTASILGALLGISVFTRFEGCTYSILIGFGCVYLWRRGLPLRRCIVLGATAGLVFLLFFVSYYLQFRQLLTSNSQATFALLRTIETTPFRGDLLAERIADTVARSLQMYPLGAWIVVLGASLWAAPRERLAVIGFVCLIVFNGLYIFVLAAYPLTSYLVHFVPFFAILFGYSVVSLGRFVARNNLSVRRLVLIGAVILVSIPGLTKLVALQQTAPFAFRNSREMESAIAVDGWIEQNYPTLPVVYSLCPKFVLFSRSNVYLIYRLADRFNDPTNWNSPAPLAATMKTSGSLLVMCDQEVFYQDWVPFLYKPHQVNELGRMNELFVQIATIGKYRVFQAA